MDGNRNSLVVKISLLSNKHSSWRCKTWEYNLKADQQWFAHAIYFSSAETEGSQKVPSLDCCYHAARGTLSSLVWFRKFMPSALSAMWCSDQSWWFVQVPGNPEGSHLSHTKRQYASLCLLRSVSWAFYLMGNSYVATPWKAVLIPTHSGDITFCYLCNYAIQATATFSLVLVQ